MFIHMVKSKHAYYSHIHMVTPKHIYYSYIHMVKSTRAYFHIVKLKHAYYSYIHMPKLKHTYESHVHMVKLTHTYYSYFKWLNPHSICSYSPIQYTRLCFSDITCMAYIAKDMLVCYSTWFLKIFFSQFALIDSSV
jgi:hypothetical protein